MKVLENEMKIIVAYSIKKKYSNRDLCISTKNSFTAWDAIH